MTTQTEQSYLSVEDRRVRGEQAAKQTPVSSHAEWRAGGVIGPIRWSCWSRRTPPARRTWCRCGTAG